MCVDNSIIIHHHHNHHRQHAIVLNETRLRVKKRELFKLPYNGFHEISLIICTKNVIKLNAAQKLIEFKKQ